MDGYYRVCTFLLGSEGLLRFKPRDPLKLRLLPSYLPFNSYDFGWLPRARRDTMDLM